MMENVKDVVAWKPAWAKILPRVLAGVKPSEFTCRTYAKLYQSYNLGIEDWMIRRAVDLTYFIPTA